MHVTFAADAPITCSTYTLDTDMRQVPLTVILCPVVKLLNILIIASAFIFAIFVIIGAVKLSLALGDPKGYEAAKWSLFYSLLGFAIILAFFSLLRIIVGLFAPGASIFEGVNSPFSAIQEGFSQFNRFIYVN